MTIVAMSEDLVREPLVLTGLEEGPDPDEASPDQTPDPLETLDLGGETFSVSPALKARILAQTDLARTAADIERERAALAEDRAGFEGRLGGAAEDAAMGALDGLLSSFASLDWAGAARADPRWAQEAWGRYADTRQVREAMAGLAAERAQAAAEWQRGAQARAAKQALAELAAGVPGFSDQTAAAMAAYAASEFGFTPDEVAGVTDGRLLKLLYRGYAAATTARARAAQATAPVMSLRGGSSPSGIDPATDDFAAFERYADARLKPTVMRVIAA